MKPYWNIQPWNGGKGIVFQPSFLPTHPPFKVVAFHSAMDSNSIAQLVAAFNESHKAATPAINQNSVLIWTMVISFLTPPITALTVWLTKRSTEAKLDNVISATAKQEVALIKQGEVITKQVEVLQEVHKEVNSKTAVLAESAKAQAVKTEELVKTNATLVEELRGKDVGIAVAAASHPQSQGIELSPAAIAQIVKAFKETA